jgi:peroxiredoxin Q/BCP
MRATIKRAAVALLGTALVAGTALAAEELKVGDKAPDFELKGSDGKTYKLSDFRGKKPVVIAWFPKAFTGGCTKQCTSYAKGNAELQKLNVAIFTASVDDAETNAKFAKSLGAEYPILSDPTKEVARAYGVLPEGRPVTVRWTFYIDKEGVIRAVEKQIQTETAAEQTAAKLRELGLAGG